MRRFVTAAVSRYLARAAAVLVAVVPLAGCLSYTEAPPAPVIVTAPEPAPATVLRPSY